MECDGGETNVTIAAKLTKRVAPAGSKRLKLPIL
jgi:hypothetical protein